MTRDSVATWSRAPWELGSCPRTETGRWGVMSLMRVFQRDTSQVLEKGIPVLKAGKRLN